MAIRMKLTKGDIFRIRTKLGFGFLQYIETDDMGVEFIRVLEPINIEGQISQLEVDEIERWNIGFPLKAAVRKKLVEKIGNFNVPTTFATPEYARSEHNIRGEFIGWHIVHRPTLKKELKKTLTDKEMRLSPHGIMNDTLIIDRLEENWRLENWEKSL